MRWFWILLFFVACNTTDSTDQNGKVVGISDGDTFTILTTANQQVKVRLYGIDCPERGQEFGSAARQALSNLIFGHIVRIDKKDTDRYGRLVAIVYNNKGINVNEQLLRDGFAWHYKQYDQNPAWADLVYEAKRKKKGLWEQVNPTPPWLWRQEKRNVAK